MYNEYALLPPTVSDSVLARAGLLWLDPGTTLEPWYHRSLPCPDWSYTTVMTHVVPAQKESCVAALATPPGASNPMSRLVLSDARRTWYRFPAYARYSARVVLCAAMHGVPPAA